MNNMEKEADILTAREKQVAELIAWGASYKEVPALLQERYGGREISVNTVTNTMQNIFTKLKISKAGELAAWWFVAVEGVDAGHAPFRRRIRERIYALVFLLIMIPHLGDIDQAVRPQRSARGRVEQVVRGARRREA